MLSQHTGCPLKAPDKTCLRFCNSGHFWAILPCWALLALWILLNIFGHSRYFQALPAFLGTLGTFTHFFAHWTHLAECPNLPRVPRVPRVPRWPKSAQSAKQCLKVPGVPKNVQKCLECQKCQSGQTCPKVPRVAQPQTILSGTFLGHPVVFPDRNTQRLQTQLIKVNVEAGQGLPEGPRTYLEPPELLTSLTQLVRVICRNGSFHGFLM